MTEPGTSRGEESNYFVLLNTLKEAHLQMRALEVVPEGQELCWASSISARRISTRGFAS